MTATQYIAIGSNSQGDPDSHGGRRGMTRQMVELPLELIESLFKRDLHVCEYCEQMIATHACVSGLCVTCDKCLYDAGDDELGHVSQVSHIDAAREFNAALQAAREDGTE
jgi:hypothetical protein